MLIKAQQRYVRMSPRKLRLVAESVRGLKDPGVAISYLEHISKKAARPVIKTLKQAISNAKSSQVSFDNLRIRQLSVESGPIYKRWRAVSQGRPHSVHKRTSHISVILEAEPQEKQKNKKDRNGKEEKQDGSKS